MNNHPPKLLPRVVSRGMQSQGRAMLAVFFAMQLAAFPCASAGTDAAGKAAGAVSADPVLATMQRELNRAKADLTKSDPAPYFLSYTVYDQDQIMIAAAYGGLLTNTNNRRRSADVTMRVGTAQLDNIHGQSRASGMMSGTLPLSEDPDAEARVLWELTDRAYRRAAPAYLNVKTNTAVQAEEEDKSPDFTKEMPTVHVDTKLKEPAFDRSAWEDEARRLSAAFRKYPHVYFATVVLQVSVSNSRMVSSEGTAIATPSASAPPEPPSPITVAIIGTSRSLISNRLRAIASDCPRSSAPNPAHAPGVSMKVITGTRNFSAIFMRRSAFRYPSGWGIPKLR